MSDNSVLKPKLQIRNGTIVTPSTNGDKTPTPTTPSKLLLNHGKPNFTIQRSPSRAQENGNTYIASASKNDNYNPYKTASSSVSRSNSNYIAGSNGTLKRNQMQNGNAANGDENEMTKVVLRHRFQASEASASKDPEDESVPEFIRRQRQIQERLAKENVLDFEKRRSGYFTQVLITPTSPNRQSFTETMSSPAIVPALEVPPQQQPHEEQTKAEVMTTTAIIEETKAEISHQMLEEHNEEHYEEHHEEHKVHEEEEEDNAKVQNDANNNNLSNGHAMNAAAEEEEVARAIEEVNKAVAGEDDDSGKITEEKVDEPVEAEVEAESSTWQHIEVEAKILTTNDEEETPTVAAVTTSCPINDTEAHIEQNGHSDAQEQPKVNGHSDVTISHVNGFDGPHIPTPDPSGTLGVNYEPKTVVSFSKDLGAEPNKYPDTVKVTRQEAEETSKQVVDEVLQEITKLKFDIKADDQDVQVTPVLRAE